MRRLIADIVIGERFRRDLGDLSTLAASIKARGLINPVTIDATGNLIAGHRRIEALKLLGEIAVDVRVIDTLGDAVKVIELERDENTERKAMTGGELSDLAATLASLRRPEASARQGRPGQERSAKLGETVPVRVDESVGKALGIGKSTAQDLIQIGRAARSENPDERDAGQRAQAQLDAGRGVQTVARELREKTGRTKSATPTITETRDAAERRRQDRLWRNLGQQAAGLANAIPHLREGGTPQDEAEALRTAQDLRKLRTVISQTIDFLEGKSTP